MRPERDCLRFRKSSGHETPEFTQDDLFQKVVINFLDKVGYVRSQNADEKRECECGKINESTGP